MLAHRNSTTLLVSELWSQVRALADHRELDLDLRLLGKPGELSPESQEILRHTVSSVANSAAAADELHHLALELAYRPDALNVRIEHDGTLEGGARSNTEQEILSYYGEIGALGGSLALSSGRGFGMRLEMTLPLAGGEVGTARQGDLPATTQRRSPIATTSDVRGIVERLTPQEEATLSLLASGLSNKEISDKMHLGVGTVKFHLAQIYQKLGVQGRGRGAAVARARELGLLFD